MKRAGLSFCFLFVLAASPALTAQPFVHPGCLSQQADFARMKTKVQAGAHPWIDSWNILIANSHSQSNYVPGAVPILQRGNGGGACLVNDTYPNATASVTATNCTDSGVGNGTNYYYVITAMNAVGQSTNSAPAVATPVSLVQPQLSYAVSGNQLQFNWPLDHRGWELQAQTNTLNAGLGTNWAPVTGSASTNQMFMPLNPVNGSVFYRLIYP